MLWQFYTTLQRLSKFLKQFFFLKKSEKKNDSKCLFSGIYFNFYPISIFHAQGIRFDFLFSPSPFLIILLENASRKNKSEKEQTFAYR